MAGRVSVKRYNRFNSLIPFQLIFASSYREGEHIVKNVNKVNKEALKAQSYLVKGDTNIDLSIEGKNAKERRHNLRKIINLQKNSLKLLT